jgi:hypothetical protein
MELFCSLLKILMKVDVISIRVADLPKGIHVKLADEGAEITVFKISWQDFLGEAADVFYVEGVSCGCPADGVFYLSVLYQMEATSTISCSLVMNREV